MMLKKSQILNKIELRQSSIHDYLNCPLMFRFKHLEELTQYSRHPAAIHGSTMHRLLYLIHESKWNMKVEHYYREIFEKIEFKGNESLIPVRWKDREKELKAYEANAVEILDNYRKKIRNQKAFIILAETEFRVKINGLWFTGTIDQVRRNSDGTIEMIDFKTGKQQPNLTFLINDWQLNLYTYALKFGEFKIGEEWIQMDLLPDFSSWYFLRHHEIRKRNTVNGKIGEEKGNPLIRTEKGLNDLRLFRKDLKNLMKNMLRDSHYPNPDFCQLCGYQSVCLDRRNPIPELLVEEAKEILNQVEV